MGDEATERGDQHGMTYVTHERVEGTEGRPSRAKSLGRVTSITTNVCSDHRHLVHASEAEDAGDGIPIMFPQAEIIS